MPIPSTSSATSSRAFAASTPTRPSVNKVGEHVVGSQNRSHDLILKGGHGSTSTPVNSNVVQLQVNVERTNEAVKRIKREAGEQSAALVAASSEDPVLQADLDLQAAVNIQLMFDPKLSVPVPPVTSMHVPIELYKRALQAPDVVAWFESKGLDLTTVRIGKESVTGNVTFNGVSRSQEFGLWDESGWWQVSAQVRAVAQALDPAEAGLPYMSDELDTLPCDVILHFYDLTPPGSSEEGNALGNKLQRDGWPAFNPTRRDDALDRAEQLINSENSRAQLISELEKSVEGLADDESLSFSGKFNQAAIFSPLEDKCLNTVQHLWDFLNLPEMVVILESYGLVLEPVPIRISDGKFEICWRSTNWNDFTENVMEESNLIQPFNDLLERVKDTGNALYSDGAIDLHQILNFSEMGSFKTVGEVRNIIRWLKTSLPPTMPLGDCGSKLLEASLSPGVFTPQDRTNVKELSRTLLKGAGSIIDALGGDLLLNKSVEYRRNNAEKLLQQMLKTERAAEWSQEILKKLEWYGATDGQTVSQDLRNQLLLAAIKLEVHLETSGKPGSIAGYNVYQQKNLGRDLKDVREDMEQYLVKRMSVSPEVAPLIAHLFLIDAAPEFLTLNINESIQLGSTQWMVLRLGAGIAELTEPGRSRAMTMEQLMALALLTPTSDAQQQLFQTISLDIILAWGVMSGAVVRSHEFGHSSDDYFTANAKFATQRADLARAIDSFRQEPPTRKDLAVKERAKFLPEFTEAEIEELMIQERGDFEHNISYDASRTNFVEAYMDRRLFAMRWELCDDDDGTVDHQRFDALSNGLPNLESAYPDSVDKFLNARKDAYLTSLKYLISKLPLEDRQQLEHGEIKFFTLREESNKPKADETTEDRAALRGRQGTLLRSEFQQKIVYFEVFPGLMKIVKRMDLEKELPLDGEMQRMTTRLGRGTVNDPTQRGTELPFDFSAYSTGSEPIVGAKSEKIIIENLGRSLPSSGFHRSERLEVSLDSYSSNRIANIVDRVVNGNLLQGEREFLFKKGMGETTEEANQAYWNNVQTFLVNLIPFVGCVEDLRSGDRIRIINGGFGCALDLLGGLSGLAGGVSKITRVIRTFAPLRVKAFQVIKIGASTLVAAVNPLDGVLDLAVGGARGIGALNKMFRSGAFGIATAGIERMRTCLEKLRCFFGGVVGEAAGVKLPQRVGNAAEGVEGTLNGEATIAVQANGKWYSINDEGNPFGRALVGFLATPVANA